MIYRSTLSTDKMKRKESANSKKRKSADGKRKKHGRRWKQDALDADADAAADRERKRKALAIREEERQAEARAKNSELDARPAEHRAELVRRSRSFAESQERLDSAAEREERRTKRRDERGLATMKSSATIEDCVLRERKKLIDTTADLMREAQISGGGGSVSGMILGEISANKRLIFDDF